MRAHEQEYRGLTQVGHSTAQYRLGVYPTTTPVKGTVFYPIKHVDTNTPACRRCSATQDWMWCDINRGFKRIYLCDICFEDHRVLETLGA